MANVKAFPLDDEFEGTIDPVDRPRGSFFSSGNWINFMRGVDKGGDGVRQTFEEAKEGLGISPPGSAAFFTQEAKKRQAKAKCFYLIVINAHVRVLHKIV